MEPVVLIHCKDAIEANILKGVLDNAGIESFITGESSATIFPSNTGEPGDVQILVDEKDLERARELIKE